MPDEKFVPADIDSYIAHFPAEFQERMTKLREIIHAASPEATEKISWQMPTFYLFGNLIHFAASKNHIGIYPGINGVEYFKTLTDEFATSKGGIQFPMAKPIPYELISELVRFRTCENLAENEAKLEANKSKSKAKKQENTPQ